MAIAALKNTNLEKVWLSSDRHPAFRVVIWNPREATTVQDVVMNRWGGMAYDISEFVERVSISQNQVFENSQDAVSSRIRLDVLWDDVGLRFDWGNCPITQRLFRDGTPIRVYMGDRRIYREDWPPVFTGTIRGYPGAQRARRGKRNIIVVAFGRAQTFQNQIIVGQNWSYGTDFGTMAVDTAMQELGLEREEVRFGEFSRTTKHRANALAQVGKMQGLYEIMRTVGRKPYFNAAGFLTSHDTSFDKPPVYTFDRSPVIIAVDRIQELKQTVNSVEVIGLDSNLSKVVSPVQELGEVNTTIGYFDSTYRELIYYSKDRTRRAEGTYIDILSSRNLGGSAEWDEVNEFSGRLKIDTGYAPWVTGSIALVWTTLKILEAWLDSINEPRISFYIKLLSATTMVALLIAMQTIGRWRVKIFGQPFEYVYQELRAIASLKGVPSADLVEKTQTIHWLSNITDVAARAKTELRRELSKSHLYRITMASNPIIEVDDLITIRDEGHGIPDFETYYVTAIETQLDRGPATDETVLTAWHIKSESSL